MAALVVVAVGAAAGAGPAELPPLEALAVLLHAARLLAPTPTASLPHTTTTTKLHPSRLLLLLLLLEARERVAWKLNELLVVCLAHLLVLLVGVPLLLLQWRWQGLALKGRWRRLLLLLERRLLLAHESPHRQPGRQAGARTSSVRLACCDWLAGGRAGGRA